MKKVAKLVLIDSDNTYLLLYRNNHPIFGNEPDLPGGTLEKSENTRGAMIREVQEEIGATIDAASAKEVYQGTEYSRHGTHYSLFIAKITHRPTIHMSWEHLGYEWLPKTDFLATIKTAKDTYMHMVYDVVSSSGRP